MVRIDVRRREHVYRSRTSKETGVAGDAAHHVRVLVLHHPVHEAPPPRTLIRGRDPRELERATLHRACIDVDESRLAIVSEVSRRLAEGFDLDIASA